MEALMLGRRVRFFSWLCFYRKRLKLILADSNFTIKNRQCAWLLIFLLAAPALTFAEEPSNAAEYQVKAAFLYKFCFYVEWPPTAFAGADSPIVLGIVGPESIGTELDGITRGHVINGRTLQVRRVDANSNLAGVHMLFIARSEQARLPQFVAQAQKMPLLLVTESPGGLDDGGGINFAVQDNRIRFDVGLDSTNRQGLRLSAQLLKVARAVRGEVAP